MAKKKIESGIRSNARSPKPAFADIKNPATESAEKREREAAMKLCEACNAIEKDLDGETVSKLQQLHHAYLKTQRGKLADEPRVAWRGFVRAVSAKEATKAINHLHSFAGLISIKHKLGKTEVTTTESKTTEPKKD